VPREGDTGEVNPYKHVLSAVGVAVFVIGLTPASALAAPPTTSGDALNQLNAASEQEERVGEQYNVAMINLQARRADVRQADADLATARQAVAAAKADEAKYRGDVDRWIQATAQGADLSSMSALLTGRSASDFLDREWLLAQVSKHNNESMDGLRNALDKASDASERARRAQQRASDAATRAKQVSDTLAQSEQAAQNAENAARAAYNQLTSPQRAALKSDTGVPFDTGDIPAGAAGIAVKAALSQVGTPYVYGGTTPGVGLDCSALVRYAYRQTGISLPRVTTQQFQIGTPVAESDLQPGDLLFFGTASDIHHVAMYIGGGKIVHAPDVGQAVKVVPISGGGSDYFGSKRIVG
jgi:peptidoglycan DL-endopeptidase CwlO